MKEEGGTRSEGTRTEEGRGTGENIPGVIFQIFSLSIMNSRMFTLFEKSFAEERGSEDTHARLAGDG